MPPRLPAGMSVRIPFITTEPMARTTMSGRRIRRGSRDGFRDKGVCPAAARSLLLPAIPPPADGRQGWTAVCFWGSLR